MRKNILLSLDAWYPQISGPNVVVTNYKKYLEQNNECKLLVPKYSKKLSAEALEKTGVEVEHIKSVSVVFGGYRNTLPLLDKRALELANESVDIYHSHSPFGLGHFFATQAEKYNKPSILTIHTKYQDDFMRCTHSKVLTDFMMQRMMKVIDETDYIWTVSDGAEKMLREYGYTGDVTVIRNGTDMTLPQNPEQLIDRVNREYNLTDEENVLLFVGRIVCTKNLPFVFDALRYVKQRRVPFKMLIVGDGEERKNYQKLIEEWGLENNVIFTGAIYDREYLKAFYMRADLFVFPSEYDTASLCPLEAATFSLPTILLKDCPTAETIKNDFSGYEEKDSSKLWAERIVDILSDKTKLKEVGSNARKFVYRSWEDVVKEVESNYDSILERWRW